MSLASALGAREKVLQEQVLWGGARRPKAGERPPKAAKLHVSNCPHASTDHHGENNAGDYGGDGAGPILDGTSGTGIGTS